MTLQTVVSRETSPLGSGVLSVTMLRAGDAYNVIPDEVMFGGTIRWVYQGGSHPVHGLGNSVPAVVGCCGATTAWANFIG